MPAEAPGEMTATGEGAATTEVSSTAERVATASESVPTSAAAGSVPAATASTASTASARGMLRPSQSRRSRYRNAQKQGADGSHYISHARVGHNSSPLFSAAKPLLRALAGLSIRRRAAMPVQARAH